MANAVKLTKRSIDQAELREKPYELWDTEIPGFGLKIQPTGTKTFVLRYRPKGQGAAGPKRYITIGRHGILTVDQARDQARSILGQVATGDDPAAPQAPPVKPMTFGEVADAFLKEHADTKRRASTARDYRAMLNSYVLPILKQRPLGEITRSEIAKLHHDNREHPYRANRIVAVISSLYTFAAKREFVAQDFNPAWKIEKYEETARARFLTDAELEKLGQVLDAGETTGLDWPVTEKKRQKVQSKHERKLENRRTVLPFRTVTAIRLLLLTGARLREILELQWDQIHLDRGLILLLKHKTSNSASVARKFKTIILSAAADALLRNYIERAGNAQTTYVFASTEAVDDNGNLIDKPPADLKRPWDLIRHHAGLNDVRLHDLRHTFASYGAGAGLGLPIIGKLLGHTQPATTARYAHLDNDPAKRATDTIGEHLMRAMSGKKDTKPDLEKS